MYAVSLNGNLEYSGSIPISVGGVSAEKGSVLVDMLSSDKLEALAGALESGGSVARFVEVNKGSIIELQRSLLRATLAYAISSVPYYRSAFKSCADAGLLPDSSENLDRLPVLTRDIIRSRPADLLNPKLKLIGARHTSGTTSRGAPLQVFVSREEAVATQSLISIVRQIRGDSATSKGITLVVHTGRIPPVGANPDRFVEHLVAEYSEESWNAIATEVMTKHPLAGAGYSIDRLVLPVPTLLRPVTSTITSAGLSPREAGIRSITTTGGYVTSALRRIAKDDWNAQLFNVYGMGEVGLAAIECSKQKLHFLFTLIPEVVDPATLATLGDGQPGLLLLTTLYPFQQAMPLIRYSTGDIVSISRKVCECGSKWPFVQRFVGRMAFSQQVRADEGRGQWISPVTTKDVLEDFPAIFAFDYYGRLRFKQHLIDDKDPPRLVVSADLSPQANLLPEATLDRARKEVQEALVEAHQSGVTGPLPFELELRFEPYSVDIKNDYFLRM